MFEGLNELCKYNSYIGSHTIVGIPPLPRGSIIIKLLFSIGTNGILHISISGFKNPSDNSAKSFDFKLTEKIRLISSNVGVSILKRILLNK